MDRRKSNLNLIEEEQQLIDKLDTQAFSIHEDFRINDRLNEIEEDLHQKLLSKRKISLNSFGLLFNNEQQQKQEVKGQDRQNQEQTFSYDKIKGKKIRDNIYYEFSENSLIIMDLLKLRENYRFQGHQDYVHVDKYTKYDSETQEPEIIWNVQVDPLPILQNVDIRVDEGIYHTIRDDEKLIVVPSILAFIKDIVTLLQAINNNSVASFCYNRLQFLQKKYAMHQTFNHQFEAQDQKQIKSRDLYNVFKVDNHIHHSAAMSAKHLLSFIKRKWTEESETSVLQINGKKLKLSEVFQEIGLEKHELSLNALDVMADKGMFKRFDRFNNKYNPLGQPKLRDIFLKSDNYIKGRYLAELTQELIDQLEESKYVGCEWRVSIYGKSMEEWHKLSKWLVQYKLYSSKVRWMIQIPRLYQVYKKSGLINNFQEMIDNIFRPLFDVTINPTLDPFLYQALFQIVGFDTVDDESLYEYFSTSILSTLPKDWNKEINPPYTYWIFYIYANLYSLNALRKLRGLNTFKFRPHCGEAGDLDHLATAYLMADGINHGIELNKSPVLMYIYYLQQIGLAMSPVSNNKLFCRYSDSPFRKFFEIGMNVTLSTDDPLILHLTSEPLIEEYSIASQIFDFSSIELAEIARNSVMQSGFERQIKEYWAGAYYWHRLKAKNNQKITNIPDSRFEYRYFSLNEEYEYIESWLDHTSHI